MPSADVWTMFRNVSAALGHLQYGKFPPRRLLKLGDPLNWQEATDWALEQWSAQGQVFRRWCLGSGTTLFEFDDDTAAVYFMCRFG